MILIPNARHGWRPFWATAEKKTPGSAPVRPVFAQVFRSLLLMTPIIFSLTVFTTDMALATAARPAVTAERPTPHLYEVRNGSNVSWIFGTFHAGIALEPFRELIEPRLTKAKTVYFEVEEAERSRLWATDPVHAIQTSETLATKGAPLSKELKKRAVEEYGIPEILANTLRRDSCSLFLEAMEARAPRLDSEIAVLARALKRPIASLDTDDLREQADMIDTARGKSRDCDVVDLFMSTPARDLKSESETLLAHYISGSLAGFEQVPREDITGGIYRNLAWIEKLTPAMKRQSTFAAVGVSHLYGERGVLELLKRNGFEVRRIGRGEPLSD